MAFANGLAATTLTNATEAVTTGTANPQVTTTVQHMMGTLWYEMLSAMNENGGTEGLGPGGEAFQGMFLWNVAQNDFGKYDTALTQATIRQIGGRANVTPGAAPSPAAAAGAAAPAPEAPAEAAPAEAAAGGAGAASGTVSAAQVVSFARAVWPAITAAAQKLGVPPVALLAQSALETGWGTAMPGNNLFGIKAVDGETGTTRATHEVVDGIATPQLASFRDYGSAAASVADFVSHVQSGFSAAVGQGSVAGFAHALAAGGYATDPAYAAKIVTISQSPMMAQALQAVGGGTAASPAP